MADLFGAVLLSVYGVLWCAAVGFMKKEAAYRRYRERVRWELEWDLKVEETTEWVNKMTKTAEMAKAKGKA